MSNVEFQRQLQQRLAELAALGQRRTERTVDCLPGGLCRISGRELVNFGGNDYLNLAHEVSCSDNVREVFAGQVGATASALVCGRSQWHDRLESALAGFEDTEAALLFPTGFAANLGLISSFVQTNDAVFCDRDNHASIIDACRSCAGRMLVYRGDRLESLDESLRRRRGEYGQVFIVTDGVFSMDGCVPDLGLICEIAERHDALVIVDEAHGTGVLGEHGRGACDFHNVEHRVLARVGTMSKALGGLGGFVAADATTVDWLRNTARSQFFSTALPPAICAAMLESLQIVQSEPQRRQNLAQLTAFAHQQISDLGLQTVESCAAPIVPILLVDEESAVRISSLLMEAGWFVPAIRPPTVARGTARLRLTLTVGHNRAQLAEVLACVRTLVESHHTKCTTA
ncbi:MAG: aminotransferase class I/II-fold pyridoxal phosphate-dependent enzyme [Fuerstiella sp.]|nr:aminotransferase class I/II-fold pyridoxal phosphate-dependent enzyme [Fuerstiella sp.]MCP4853945.1 aminotransferase class I/II-fold pyridoxal phosphate-dependent enzyme [Fuerstiella sp.]